MIPKPKLSLRRPFEKEQSDRLGDRLQGALSGNQGIWDLFLSLETSHKAQDCMILVYIYIHIDVYREREVYIYIYIYIYRCVYTYILCKMERPCPFGAAVSAVGSRHPKRSI